MSLTRRSIPQKLWLSVALALLLWLPRGLALDRFVAVDERSWLTRSGNFYLALSQGDWAATFQRYHPGVTTMWLGMGGFLWGYPDYPNDAAGQITSMSEGIEDFLAGQGYEPLDLLAAGRSLVVLAEIGLLLLAFWLAVDLLGLLPALAGLLLIAFEPFLLGLSRMLHVDGLSSHFMLVALLAYFRYRLPDVDRGGRRRDLVLSGAMAGLAWLSKSPALVLIPFMGLTALLEGAAAWRQGTLSATRIRDALVALFVWGLIAAGVFVLFWPAMWVDPLGSLRAIFSAAGESAAEGHSKDIFYHGRALAGDPGPSFYPVTYLWRTTPLTLVGLLLGGAAWVWRGPRRLHPPARQSVGLLLLFALVFLAFMTLGSKKFPRYFLPAYMPLGLVAGVGWVWALGWIPSRNPKRVVWGGVALVATAQALLALPHFPYYFTYYNPLLGGSSRAPQVMMIGLGEGMDQAARYLNAKPHAADLRAAAWYRGGSFNYIFEGQDLDIEDFYQADYAVLYAHQWQRGVPDPRMLDYFAGLTPEYTVRLHGLDYAWVYAMAAAPPPTYFTDWAGAIRLVEVQRPDAPLLPGSTAVVRLRFYVVGTLDTNLSVLVRLVDGAGQEVARSEGWPFGSPTSTWQPGDVYVDGHELLLPAHLAPGYYRIEVGFYDPSTQQLISPTVAGTTTPRADLLAVDYLTVGPLPAPPSSTLPISLGDQVRLLGVESESGALNGDARLAITPGGRVPLTFFWQATRSLSVDYTQLLHLIGSDGQLAAQWDRPLVVPASLWPPEATLVDPVELTLPDDLAPGEYRLVTGLYDLATLQRLPVRIQDRPAGDTVPLGVLTLE